MPAAKVKRKANAADDATFNLVLLIIHPDIDTTRITSELGLKPFRAMTRGQPRTGIHGAPIGGVYRDSRWNHIEHHAASHVAARAVEAKLKTLEAHSTFLAELQRGGGTLSLFLNLPGVHRGEMIEPEVLGIAARLGVSIGFEIFPDSDGEPRPGHVRGKA